MKMNAKELLENSKFTKEVLYLDIIGANLEEDEEGKKVACLNARVEEFSVKIPFENGTLRVPKKLDTSKAQVLKNFLTRYIGCRMPVVITEVAPKERKATASIRLASEMLSYSRKGLKEGEVISANVLCVTGGYAVLEYKGIITTVGAADTSYVEISSLDHFYKQDENVEMKVMKYDAENSILELSRKELVGDKFKELVVDAKHYTKDGVYVGTVARKLRDSRLLIEMEPEVTALGYIISDKQIRIGDKVLCGIRKIDEKNRKLLVRIKKVL